MLRHEKVFREDVDIPAWVKDFLPALLYAAFEVDHNRRPTSPERAKINKFHWFPPETPSTKPEDP